MRKNNAEVQEPKEKVSFKQRVRKLAGLLSNFKLLSRIMICLSAFAFLVAIGAFIAFQYSCGVDPVNGSRICAFGLKGAKREIIGMIFFFVLAAVAVVSVVIAYQSKEFAFPKTKLSPSRTLPVLCVANAVLEVVAAVFCILAVVIDESLIPGAWYALCALFVVSACANACMLFPILKSHYFMPKLEEEKK